MKNIFDEVGSLDAKCYEKYCLSEDILMEHAANAIATQIKQKFQIGTSVLIVCGSGNNGADGIALARILRGSFNIKLYLTNEPKTKIGELQLKRANAIDVHIIDELGNSDVVVDCLFGSGLNRKLDEGSQRLIRIMNGLSGYKIACDIPSGLGFCDEPFIADMTVTMGALKTILFEDYSKDIVGEIIVADLGVDSKYYESNSNIKLLEKSDLILPMRKKLSSHKGDFGHVCVVVGAKKGAGSLSANAALNFGTGLVTALMHEEREISPMIMSSHFIPQNTTAICVGMGLGCDFDNDELDKILNFDAPKVIDADLFSNPKVLSILEQNNILTPHPKEFVSLLKITDVANISVEELQNNRFMYIRLFCKKFQNTILVLKGANTLIGLGDLIYVNPFGSPALSKGGSGDVLSGILGALLAQNYTPIDAAISGCLALSLASMKYDKNNYSMTPLDLIEHLKDI